MSERRCEAADTCPRCGHTPGEHWPEHGEGITACLTCHATRNYTPSGIESMGPGLCTTVAEDLRSSPEQRCEACVAEAFAITSAHDPHTCDLSTPPAQPDGEASA